MRVFRSLAHLVEQLGDERFTTLIDSGNTGKVKEFCDQLLKDVLLLLPTTMTVGGRTYDILGFPRGDEESVGGHTMVAMAKEMNAHLGREDVEHILKNQDDVPVALRGKVVFVFTDWRHPGGSGCVAVLCWSVGDRRWVRYWDWLGSDWHGNSRVLRRK